MYTGLKKEENGSETQTRNREGNASYYRRFREHVAFKHDLAGYQKSIKTMKSKSLFIHEIILYLNGLPKSRIELDKWRQA